MIDAIRNWLITVIAAAFLIAAVQSLVPEGNLRRITSLVGGLVLLLTLIQPMLRTDLGKVDIDYGRFAREIENRRDELQQSENTALSELIAEKTEAYILDKAKELGLSCTVRVTTEPGEDGTPVPSAATLSGGKSEALADYMEQELGIPKVRQIWNETN